MKNKLLKLIIIVAAIIVIVLIGIAEGNSSNNSGDEYYYASVDGEMIDLYRDGGRYYLFLPSFANENHVKLSANAKLLVNDSIVTMQSANIPAVFITLKNGEINDIYASKENELTAQIKVINPDGSVDYTGKVSSIKGRGNYAWNTWDKKPFSINLAEAEGLLGMKSGYGYALISGATDATFIRTDIAHGIEEALNRDTYVRGRSVDLYIDGEYLGNYYLSPTVEIGEERVNISDLASETKSILKKTNKDAIVIVDEEAIKGAEEDIPVSDITGGYIVEREFDGRYVAEADQIKGGFVTENEEYFVVKSPGMISLNQAKYLKDTFDLAEEIILGGDREDAKLSDVIDIESFAKRYLVEETVKNYDAAISSVYYYKDSDVTDRRIHAGPGWDYDMSLGNYLDWMDYSNQTPEGLTRLSNSSGRAIWYEALYDNEEYHDIVNREYHECVSPYLEWLITSGIDEYRDELAASAKMDAIRWKSMYDGLGYSAGDKAEYDKLKEFIRVRKEFLEKSWSK